MNYRKPGMTLLKYLIVALLVLGVLPFNAKEVYADGGVSVSTDHMSMNINDEKVFRIKADNCVADIDIYSSDESIAMVSQDAVWLDNESVLITVTAHKAGNCILTIDVKDAATYDEQRFTATYRISVEVKKDLLPQEVLTPYASIESSEVSQGTKLFLHCDTPDSTIYYSINDAGYVEYDDALTLSSSIADADKKILISAYATKASYTDSPVNEYQYTITESEEDYGTITEEDRQIYDDPSEIPQGFWLTGVKDMTYTGKALTQENVHVYYHTTLLEEKKDYSISYKNNTNAGTAILNVTGKGNYNGSLSKTFTIKGITIDPQVTVTDTYGYSKSGVLPTVKVANNGKNLKNKTDYTVTILNSAGNAVEKMYEAGQYTIKVNGNGNYSFIRQAAVKVAGADQKFVSKLSISLPSSKLFDYEYDGTAKEPIPTVKDGKVDLKDELYDLFDIRYENNVNAGTASVIITAKDSCKEYAGSVTKTFKINGIALSKAKLDGFVSSLDYSGGEVRQNITLTLDGKTLKEGTDYVISYSDNTAIGKATMLVEGRGIYSGSIKKTYKINGFAISKATVTGIYDKGYTGTAIVQDGLVVRYDGKVLTQDQDYELTYKNNIKAGSASIEIKGLGAYTGTLKKSFKIIQTDISSSAVYAFVKTSYEYEKGGVKPEPVVKSGSYTLVKDVDYKLTYKNNSKVNDNSDSKNLTSVTITGKGNYKGSITKTFAITSKSLTSTNILVRDCAAGINKTSVTITDTNGKDLSLLRDYSISKVVYNENVRLSNGTQRYKGEQVYFADNIPANTVLKVTLKGKGSYTGSISVLYKTYQRSISSASASIAPREYTGEPITLSKSDIVLKDKNTVLDSSCYDIVAYKDNIKKGTATVTIKGKGTVYGGTKDIKFSIKNKNLSCTIHFDSNGAGSGSMSDQSLSQAGTLKSNNFKRSGYTFAGWSLTKNGAVAYTDKAVFKYDETCYGKTIVLYAIWK